MLTEQNIYSLCDKYRLDGRGGVEEMLFINNGRTNWRIYYDQWEVVSVYYENYMLKNKEYQEKISANIGFHRQNIDFKSLDKVLAYIKSHDRGNIVKHEKNRIDKLFEKIERNEGMVKYVELWWGEGLYIIGVFLLYGGKVWRKNFL